MWPSNLHNSREMKYVITLFHIFGAIHFCFGVFYDFTYVEVPKEVDPLMSAYGGKFKFLTFWNAITISIYFLICSVIDIFIKPKENEEIRPLIIKVRDVIFTRILFPITMFVGVTFWSLYAIDRDLVLPSFIDKYFPTWLNHILHTNIMIFVILETILVYRKYPSRVSGLATLIAYQLVYIIWFHIVHYNCGLWVYNVFNVLSLPLRILFLIFSTALGCFFYIVGEQLNKYVWGTNIIPQNKKQKIK